MLILKSENLAFFYYINYYIVKLLIFSMTLIIFKKIFTLNADYMEVNKYNFQNYTKVIHNISFIKKENETSLKKQLAIALPIDSQIYKKKLIYKTLRSIFNLNYNYSLYLIYNNRYPKINEKKNIIIIKGFFNTVFTAFNLILDSINDYDYFYITFLTPGDVLKPSTYDFLDYIEEHDIFQVYEFNKTYEKNFIKIPNYNSNFRMYYYIN